MAAVPRKRGANDGGWPHGRPAMEAHGVITQAGRHGVEEAGRCGREGWGGVGGGGASLNFDPNEFRHIAIFEQVRPRISNRS